MEPLSFEWPFPGVADARGDPPGLFDRDDLELQDERRKSTNEISILS
jgi:hypothetical protein